MYDTPSLKVIAPRKERILSEYYSTQSEPINFPQNCFTCIIDKLKENYLVATIVFVSIILACLLAPIIIKYAKTETETQLEIEFNPSQGQIMAIPLQSGNHLTSLIYQFKKNEKSFNVTIKAITPAKGRFLQESSLSQTKEINYYHKVTQISVNIDTNMNMHTRIPGDTGMNLVISEVPPQSSSALEKMPQYLPQALSSSLEEVMDKNVSISTARSYDGVYNSTTKEYRLLTVNNSYHPDEFAQFAPHEMNFCDANPKVSNFSDIVEVTNKIAATVSSIVRNLKQTIITNREQIEKIVGDINVSVSQSNGKQENTLTDSQEDAMTQCTRVGPQVLRCPDDVWRSGLLKVSNIEANDLVEVWEIVAETQ